MKGVIHHNISDIQENADADIPETTMAYTIAVEPNSIIPEITPLADDLGPPLMRNLSL